jgi:hypothetical protein
MHTALIFKEQAIAKVTGLREKSLDQPHNSIQHIEWHDLLCYKTKNKIFIPQLFIQQTKSNVLVP